jgi:hypothetical protein
MSKERQWKDEYIRYGSICMAEKMELNNLYVPVYCVAHYFETQSQTAKAV